MYQNGVNVGKEWRGGCCFLRGRGRWCCKTRPRFFCARCVLCSAKTAGERLVKACEPLAKQNAKRCKQYGNSAEDSECVFVCHGSPLVFVVFIVAPVAVFVKCNVCNVALCFLQRGVRGGVVWRCCAQARALVLRGRRWCCRLGVVFMRAPACTRWCFA